MSRPGKSPRSRTIRSTTASPLLSPTGPPCRKSSSPVETSQATAMLSRFTSSRNKSHSDDGSDSGNSENTDYFLAKPHDYFSVPKSSDKPKSTKTTHGSAYVSFPEFDQYQRRDGITAKAH